MLTKTSSLKHWPEGDCDVVIVDLCKRYDIAIDLFCIERAHRLINRDQGSPIIVKFANYRNKLKILKGKQKFREAGILVLEDFPQEVVQRRRLFSFVISAAFRSNHKARLSVDKLILDDKVYTTTDLDKLPHDLQPEKLSTVAKDVTAFYTVRSKFSNHYPCRFTTDEGTFTSVEQFFM